MSISHQIEPPRRQDAKRIHAEERRRREFNSVSWLAPWRLGGLTSLAIISVSSLCGCKKDEAASSDNTAASKAKYTIGFSQCTVKEPWRVVFNQRLEEAAAKNPDVK